MLSEHLVYSAAIAIIAGMLWYRSTGRDYSWIIIACAFVPDLDKIADGILNRVGFTLLFESHTIHHGTFHNITMMLIFAIIVAFLLHPFGIPFIDSLLFSSIGFGAHLFEDALVYPSDYMYLWPFTTEKLGLGWLPGILSEEAYNGNFFRIANTEVLLIGFVLLVAAIIIRTRVEGTDWIRWYLPEQLYRKRK
jgi:membrane-bound metal-dependent hydrolase YbcI (DUF457 family)